MSRELATSLQALDADLVGYAAHPFEVPEIAAYEARLEDNTDRQQALYNVFNHANCVLLDPHVPIDLESEPPSFSLSQRTLELAADDQAMVYTTCGDFEDYACAEAEPRFMAALDWSERPLADYGPSVALCDAADEPFALLKAYGTYSALAWRETILKVAEDGVHVPEGAIFDVGWSDEYLDPLVTNVGEGVVVVHNDVVPAYANFYRFATWLLPENVRQAFCEDAARSHESLMDKIDDVMATTLPAIGERVQDRAQHAKHLHLPDLRPWK